ncbi:hypothetical protein E8M24_28390 [Bacillus thuringiensis]|uniref:hypothetical protein n=1 Tax=Bacillus thuringiensis TaxID=1428 RepID=UPI00125F193A|nr:hypothetical protein [Bacillus thuringiensis]KAB5632316.1 hypothetical protein E8M24_28390 [Bacillus thuringiensis]HDR5271709.1 hypothetical protein [Bacillus thuringiensis]
MITITVFKGIIFEPELLSLKRNSVQRNGKIIDDIFFIGNRKSLKRNGMIFCEDLIVNNDSKQEVNNPRQEPLEHSWKRLNT